MLYRTQYISNDNFTKDASKQYLSVESELVSMSGFKTVFPGTHSFCSAKYILNKMLVTGEITELLRGHNEG